MSFEWDEARTTRLAHCLSPESSDILNKRQVSWLTTLLAAFPSLFTGQWPGLIAGNHTWITVAGTAPEFTGIPF